MIEPATPSDYTRVEEVWWASVQATHSFIAMDYLLEIKGKLQSDYLPQVQLYVWRDQAGCIQGFVGWSHEMIEMLFVHPEAAGKGIGKGLVKFAINHGLRNVDVNEANSGAIEFYRKQGFVPHGRSDLDGAGKPYPILHLARQE